MKNNGTGALTVDRDPEKELKREQDSFTELAADWEAWAQDRSCELEQDIPERDIRQERLGVLAQQYMKMKTEFDGFRKRAERDLEGRVMAEKSDFILSILEVMDNFERSLAARERMASGTGGLDAFSKGVVMIKNQLADVLAREGVLPIPSAVGSVMDPRLHEAMEAVRSKEPHGTIIEELSTGYTYKGRVLRPTRVRVAK